MPIPLIGPALAYLGASLGLNTAVAGVATTAATTAATTVAATVGPAVTAAITKAAAIGTVYIAGKGLEYTCGTAGKSYAELCKNGVDGIACFMRKANEEISCIGAVALTGKVLFDAGKIAYESAKNEANNAISPVTSE